MKKLFYVVLVVAILFVISTFVKKNVEVAPLAAPVAEAVIEEAQTGSIDAELPTAMVVEQVVVEQAVPVDAGVPMTLPATEADAPAVVAPEAAIEAEVVTPEAVVEEEIEEANPDMTKDEGETVVAE